MLNEKETTESIHALAKAHAVANEKMISQFEMMNMKLANINTRLNDIPKELISKVDIMWRIGVTIVATMFTSAVAGMAWVLVKVINL